MSEMDVTFLVVGALAGGAAAGGAVVPGTAGGAGGEAGAGAATAAPAMMPAAASSTRPAMAIGRMTHLLNCPRNLTGWPARGHPPGDSPVASKRRPRSFYSAEHLFV